MPGQTPSRALFRDGAAEVSDGSAAEEAEFPAGLSGPWAGVLPAAQRGTVGPRPRQLAAGTLQTRLRPGLSGALLVGRVLGLSPPRCTGTRCLPSACPSLTEDFFFLFPPSRESLVPWGPLAGKGRREKM